MSLSLLFAVLMGLTGWRMLRRAHFARTRRMALLPLSAAAVELMMTGLLSAGNFPLVTLLLVALRAAILLACVGALRQDAAAARRSARRAVRKSRDGEPAVPAALPAAVSMRAAPRCPHGSPGRCA